MTVALLALAAVSPNRRDALTPHVEPLLLGVYLLHFPVRTLLVAPLLGHLELSNAKSAPAIALTLVLTALLVALMKRSPLRRFL